jgi:hypothetical protein
MWPNLRHYLVPPLSNLEVYTYGINEIDPIAKEWFHYPSNKIHCVSNTLQGNLLLVYSAFFLLCNLYLAWRMVRYIAHFLLSKQREQAPPIFVIAAAFVILNLGFTLVATVNILRYQVAPMIVIVGLGIVMAEYEADRLKQGKAQQSAGLAIG